METATQDKLVDRVFGELACRQELTREYIRIALRDVELFDRKQADYGSRNIAMFGEAGVLVRAFDKAARLVNLLWDHKGGAKNEPIADSWADLSVYGVIARMVRQGVWK